MSEQEVVCSPPCDIHCSASARRQQPFSYTAGVGGVITGWDQGLLGAKLGEHRKLVIPADEGYGQSGFPAWGIPKGATLVFELEVLKIGDKSHEDL